MKTEYFLGVELERRIRIRSRLWTWRKDQNTF